MCIKKKDSQKQPCSRDWTYSRPSPSNSCCVLFSPGKCLPGVGDRGHGQRIVGLMRKYKPWGQSMTTDTITITIIITFSFAGLPLCVAMATIKGRLELLALKVGAMSGSVRWPSNCTSTQLCNENNFLINKTVCWTHTVFCAVNHHQGSDTRFKQ